MKKLLVLFALLATGCDNPKTPDFDEGRSHGWKTEKYNGHSYILYGGGQALNGITHDPDCECQKVRAEVVR